MSGNIAYLEGKGFDKNPQNINRNGRPRKQFGVILDELKNLGYKSPSDSEIVDICSLLLSLTRHELEKIAGGDEFPVIMRIIASRLLSERAFEAVEKVLDRIYGKTILKGHLEEDKIINIVIQDNPPLTEEQEMKIVEQYLKKKNIQLSTL